MFIPALLIRRVQATHRDAIQDLSGSLQEKIRVNLALDPASRCNHPDSVIRLDTGEAEPVYRRPYRVPQAMEDRVTEIIDGWRLDKVIELAPAGCRWNSPLVTALKSSGDVRVCIDPRGLNVLLINGDNFPIPIVSDLIERFA